MLLSMTMVLLGWVRAFDARMLLMTRLTFAAATNRRLIRFPLVIPALLVMTCMLVLVVAPVTVVVHLLIPVRGKFLLTMKVYDRHKGPVFT